MKFVQKLIRCAVIMWSGLASHAFSSSPLETENAIHMRLDVPGFEALSQAIREKLLKDISNQPIANLDQDLGYGVQGEFSGLSYSVGFKDFRIVPTAGALSADVELSRIAVHVDKAKFTKKVGVTLSTTCTNTNMVAGGNGSIRLHMDLAAMVNQGQVALRTNNVSFPLPDDQYAVDGPEECSGSLGVGSIVSFAIHQALKHANDTISKKVEEKIRDMVPAFGDDLNALLASEIPLKLGGSATIPLHNVILSAVPYGIDLTPEAAEFALSVNVAQDTRPLRDQFIHEQTRNAAMLSGPEVIAGTLGLRTALLNELLAQATPLLPTTIPIDPSQAPGIGQVFSRQGLSAILPDLNQIEMDEDRVYAQLGFAAAPSLTAYRMADGQVTLVFSMPDVRLALRIKQHGALVPYFNLIFAANLPIQATLDGDSVKLTVVRPGRIAVSGTWAPGYTPSVDIFEQDLANTIFSSLLDILYLDAQTALRVSHPHVDNDFIMIDLKKD